MRKALASEAGLLLACVMLVAVARDEDGGLRHLLSAVHQALDAPAPHRGSGRLQRLSCLEQRARIVCASIERIIARSDSDGLDYISEGDHILHQIADLRR